MLTDQLQRPFRDLRISVTDRCNFRCRYCMPRERFGEDFGFLPRSEVLSFEELTRVAAQCVALGVHKVRITGGEPLLRAELPRLVQMLRQLGDLDLALTTNGVLLPKHAKDLKAAGLNRLTVSLDALDPATFQAMCDANYTPNDVLAGIEAAEKAGFRSIKINTVVKRGVNDQQILPIAQRFKGTGHVVRFIEYMDVGTTNGWRLDEVVTHAEILEKLRTTGTLTEVRPATHGVAQLFSYGDGTGEVGVIASVSQPFCGQCTRGRLSAEGKFYTCLFATSGLDLKSWLRSGKTDAELRALIEETWLRRGDRYSEIRASHTGPRRRIEMSYIGG